MKKILAALLALTVLLGLVACGPASPEGTAGTEEGTATGDETTIRLMALKGPTGMGLASLLHNDKNGSGNRCDYDVELVTSAEISNIAAAITKGECDVAAVPINLASTLYAKTGGQVQVLCANTLGVLHLLENGTTVNSIADLRGKTVYATGQGSTPEYILRYVLEQNGLKPGTDLTLQFVADHTELVTYMASNIYSIGVLPEPNVSVVLSSNPSFRAALDLTEEWNKVAGADNTLIQGVFIARKAFVNEHKSLIADFLEDYNASQTLVNTDKDKGAQYIVEAQILAAEPMAKKAIPGCNITFLEGEAMKGGVKKCLQVLFDAAPASVGNALPGDDFYFAR